MNPTPRKPYRVSRRDLGPEIYRWYECAGCAARVPVWGDMPAPRHECRESVPAFECAPVGDAGYADGYRGCACGSTFPGSTGKRGRPREHCSESCRELAAARATLSKHLDAFESRATPKAWLELRTELQGRLAQRPWNRGVSRSKVATGAALPPCNSQTCPTP